MTMPCLELPNDDIVLDRIREISNFLAAIWLKRYEISNYAIPGFECRHNMAVWRGEDYIGLGEGAHGRIGLVRTFVGTYALPVNADGHTERTGVSPVQTEILTPEQDEKERRLFRLRTTDGLDITGRPDWGQALDRFAAEGLVVKSGPVYRLTERGAEVCDSILAELV